MNEMKRLLKLVSELGIGQVRIAANGPTLSSVILKADESGSAPQMKSAGVLVKMALEQKPTDPDKQALIKEAVDLVAAL